MTLSEFEALDDAAKANAVWQGKFISTRVVDDMYIQSYDLESFFVEVIYDPLSNTIKAILPGVF